MSSSGVAKIGDFGVSIVLRHDGGMLTSVAGTPAFMAPELFDENPRYDGRAADMYALGATLYCLTVGRPPYMANSELELVAKLRSGLESDAPVYPPDLPPALRHLLRRMLCKSPAERITLWEVRVEILLSSCLCGVCVHAVSASRTWRVLSHYSGPMMSPPQFLTCTPQLQLAASHEPRANPHTHPAHLRFSTSTCCQVMNHEWVTDEGTEPLARTTYMRIDLDEDSSSSGGGGGESEGPNFNLQQQQQRISVTSISSVSSGKPSGATPAPAQLQLAPTVMTASQPPIDACNTSTLFTPPIDAYAVAVAAAPNATAAAGCSLADDYTQKSIGRVDDAASDAGGGVVVGTTSTSAGAAAGLSYSIPTAQPLLGSSRSGDMTCTAKRSSLAGPDQGTGQHAFECVPEVEVAGSTCVGVQHTASSTPSAAAVGRGWPYSCRHHPEGAPKLQLLLPFLPQLLQRLETFFGTPCTRRSRLQVA